MKKYIRLIILLSCFLLLQILGGIFHPVHAQTADEQRAVWLQDDNDLDNKFTKLKDAHINVVYFGAWGSSNLQQVIDKAHAHGLQIHIWVTSAYLCAGHYSDCTTFAVGKDDWDAKLPNGMTRQQLTGPGNPNNRWIDFNVPAAQQNAINVMVNYASSYNADGVNFDYIRYDHANYSFSDHNLAEFQQMYGVAPAVMRGDQFPAFATIWGNRVSQFSQTVTRLVDFLDATTAAVFINNYTNDPTEDHGQVLTFNWQVYQISYKVIDTVLTRALNHFNSASRLYVVNSSSNNTDYSETVNWLNFLGFSSVKVNFSDTAINALPANSTLVIPAVYVYTDPIISAMDAFLKNGGNIILMDGPTTTIGGGVPGLANLQLFKNIVGASASHSYVGAYGVYTGIIGTPSSSQNHWMVSGLTSANPVTVAQATDYLNKWQAYMESGINYVVQQVTSRVHAINPNLKVSADVFPAEKGYNVGVRQNWPLWLSGNNVDYVLPMEYTLDTATFNSMITWINNSGLKGRILPGLAPYKITNCSTQIPIITGQIDTMRANNIKGFSMFESNYLTETNYVPAGCGILDTLKNYFVQDVDPYYPPPIITPTPSPSPTPTYLPGDINKDHVVNVQDYILLSNAFGTSNAAADINSDGTVNVQDYILLSNNFGKSN